MVEENQVKNTRKRSDFSLLIMSLGILFLVNYISSFVFERFDLTSEKRYSLSKPTKDIINQLQ